MSDDPTEVQSCWIDWPPLPMPSNTFEQWWQPPAVPLVRQYHFTPMTSRLSDEDVERIARRLAELLAAPGEK